MIVPYEKLTIYEVEEFYQFLLPHISDGSSKLEFDFINIQKIDMVAIQLLISLDKTCKQDSIVLVLKNFSSELQDTLKACGCDKVLEVSYD